MANFVKGIGVLRSFTNHPVRLLWSIIGLAAAILWWSLQLGLGNDLRWVAFLAEICKVGGSSLAESHLPPAFLLWSTMSLAMMLPSAVPMISTYLDIADAAQRGRERVVPAGYLVAGYAVIWLAFAAGATWLQFLVDLTPAMALADHRHAALLLILAGLYQFAPLKHACLAKCRAPMSYFLAHWSNERRQVFKMGVEQGALCFACCWALMLLMFAAGLMNVLWMAGITIPIALEKTLPSPKPLVLGSGAGLTIAGGIFLIGG
jgi:predicted metal-binding membrane protein